MSLDDSQKIAEKIENYPGERFKVIEQNFWSYARRARYENLDLDEETYEWLGEMFVCVTSIYILMEDVADAITFGLKALECCNIKKQND